MTRRVVSATSFLPTALSPEQHEKDRGFSCLGNLCTPFWGACVGPAAAQMFVIFTATIAQMLTSNALPAPKSKHSEIGECVLYHYCTHVLSSGSVPF